MDNMQMRSMYQQTYVQAYWMYHPRRTGPRVLRMAILIAAISSTIAAGMFRRTTYSKGILANNRITHARVELAMALEGMKVFAESLNAGNFSDYVESIIAKSNIALEQSLFQSTQLKIPGDVEILYSLDGNTQGSISRWSFSSPEESLDAQDDSSVVGLVDAIDTPTADELEFIERIVEAEVTGTTFSWNGKNVDEEEMLLAKIRVAQVFLNRARDTERFSHVSTLYEAMADPGASSTVASGRCWRVEVTDLTKEAVQIALDPTTEDLTDGALFFLANGAKKNKYGDYLFTDAVGHSFFK